MHLYICEICGEAYVGTEKPSDCPFCGAKSNFIKSGSEVRPIASEKITLSEISIKNLKETYKLETDAVGIYTCMADSADTYEIKSLYKRLAKVELEHATIVTKFLGQPKPQIPEKPCGQSDAENFKHTIELEENATNRYREFLKAATEKNMRIFFTALIQAETGHTQLIKNYLK